MEKVNNKRSFITAGKYRDIIIAASLFIIFDLFVLVLNFYTSFEIAEDAVSINLAGRQRMLSQRMTKALLQIDAATTEQQRNLAIQELDSTYHLFTTTFNAFKNGGMTKNTDNTEIKLVAIKDNDAQKTIAQAEKIWLPLQKNISSLIENPDTTGVLAAAVTHANSNNISLLKLMNRLTTRLAEMAQLKAKRLRMFQTIGISFALINFTFLLFHFIRKLKRSDSAAEEARKETEEILTTVNEGFFLLDKNMKLGHQHSSAMENIFKQKITPGTPFLELLQGKVSSQTLHTAEEYLELLFTDRIREKLATDLNPLIKVKIDLSDNTWTQDIHYLNIEFKRVKGDEKITHLLGSITDITQQVLLEISLEEAELRAKEEIEMLSQILHCNPAELNEFILSTEKLLLTINKMLASSRTSADYIEIINQSLPAIHKVKGDASVIGSEIFTLMAHDFENILKTVQSKPKVNSQELLPVTVHINMMLAKISTISEIVDKITTLIPSTDNSQIRTRHQAWLKQFQELAVKVSEDLNKKVNLVFNHTNLEYIEEDDALKLRDICIQMIRNAIAHGIEEPHIRKSQNKLSEGVVAVSIIAGNNHTEVMIKDDGCGLSLNKIRESLIKNKLYTPAQLNEMDPKSIIMKIFNSGISTSEKLTTHSGQGLGLEIVKYALNNLGGQLRINSREGKFTEFYLTFSNVRIKQSENEVVAA